MAITAPRRAPIIGLIAGLFLGLYETYRQVTRMENGK
jgi:hypothetical protein